MTHTFNPKPITGYKIGSITMNNVSIDSTDRVIVKGINKNYTVKVRFVKEGTTSVILPAKNTRSLVKLTSKSLSLMHGGSVEFFLLTGKRIAKVDLSSDKEFSFLGLTPGSYVARVYSVGVVQSVSFIID